MRKLEPMISPLDRAAELRTQPDQLEQLWKAPETKILRVQRNQIASTSEALQYFTADEGERFFLGLLNGVAYFALHDPGEREDWKSLREIGHALSFEELQVALYAIALVNWHSSHPRCPRCGGETRSEQGGSIRRCLVDQSDHYPRTDPAVIVLIRDKDDRVLLGRQGIWPPKRYSAFAGFVEAGESFEAAVAREVLEEAGVEVEEISYLGSQTWPFPASVMIAFDAVAKDPSTARPDGTEIESVIWLSRSELKAAVGSGEIILPPGISIARRMIEAWYGEPLSGGSAWR